MLRQRPAESGHLRPPSAWFRRPRAGLRPRRAAVTFVCEGEGRHDCAVPQPPGRLPDAVARRNPLSPVEESTGPRPENLLTGIVH